MICSLAGKPRRKTLFSDTKKKPKVLFDDLPTAQTPEKLGPYFGGEVNHLQEALRKIGIIVGENDFAGYDPRIQRVFMFSEDENEIDKFEQVFLMGCGMPRTIAFGSRGEGEMRLLARSGQKAAMKSSRPETKMTRDLEIEPTIGENDTLVDLRIFYEEKADKKLTKALNTSITLHNGESLSLLKTKLPDGSESAMEIKAGIVEKHP